MQAGTRVKVLTKSQLHFSGTVLSQDDNFLQIKDKFGKTVMLAKTEIALLEVQ